MVVYAYVGQYVASPALGSAGALVKRIACESMMLASFCTATDETF